jgi:hypothetical protein
MPWIAAAIGAAGALGGGALGARGADEAAAEAGRASQQDLALQRWIYEQNTRNNEPWRATGQGALNALAGMFGLPYMPYSSPDYGGGDIGALSKKFGGNSFSTKHPLGASGRTAQFAPGGGSAFSARQVSKMLKRGMTIDQIDKIGKLELTLNPKRMNKLVNKRGLTPEQIHQLQYGAGNEPGNTSGDPQILNPGDPGYKAFSLTDSNAPPGYNFFRQEGQRDLLGGYGAGGQGAFSGNALRGTTKFNQEYANQKIVDPLFRMAGFGSAATGAQQNAAGTYGANAGNAINNMGNARASGVANQYNMWGQGLMGAGTAAGRYYGNSNSPWANQQDQYRAYQYYGGQPDQDYLNDIYGVS